MKKTFFSIFLMALFLVVSSTCFAFTDVSNQYEYKKAIDFLQQKGIIQGYSDGTYKPYQILNRAELLKIVIQAKHGNVAEFSGQKCFSDIDVTQWSTPYICFAKSIGIVKGYKDGTFRASQNITVVEALKIGMLAYSFDYIESQDPWYSNLVNLAQQDQLVSNEINNNWNVDINRGQMADMITRIIKYRDGTLNDYLQNLVPTPKVSPTPNPVLYVNKYGAVSFDYFGGVSDVYLSVGDTFRVSDDMNIRIDSIDQNLSVTLGTRATYSIWGKTNAKSCSLVSSTGTFWTNSNNYKFREFTDSFLELIDIIDNKVHLKQYYGQQAKQRCDQISGSKQPIACNFYPRENYASIANNKFKMFADKSISQEFTEFFISAMNNCYNSYLLKIPKLATIQPFNSFWKLYYGPDGVFSTDYERIMIPKSLSNNSLLQNPNFQKALEEVKSGQCTLVQQAIPHELTHALFATTPLQDIYDAGVKNEIPNKNGLADMAEGFAEFMPYFTAKDPNNPDVKSYYGNKIKRCGTDSLIDIGDLRYTGATAAQMKYSNILAGQGFNGLSRYDMGFCFYKRVQNDCGDGGIMEMLNRALDYAGIIEPHTPILKYLANYCGENKVTIIMNDFGLDPQILNVSQKHPNEGFPNNLNTYACME